MAVGLRGRDVDSKGRLPAASVRAALQAAHLPVSSTLLDSLVTRYLTLVFLKHCSLTITIFKGFGDRLARFLVHHKEKMS